MGIHQEMVEMKLNRNDPEGQERSYRMKKVIAILLVLLVAGVAFGAADPDGATLTLGAAMGNRTNHGFIGDATGLDTFGEIYNSTVLGNYSASGLDLESSASQSVGYYVFASNTNTKVEVSFKADPLVSPNLGTKVPYILTATYEDGSNIVAPTTAPEWDLTAGGSLVAGGEVASVESDLINLASVANGVKWASYSLAVVFDATGNIDFGLEEGAYTGSVVASIVTQ
jgi:hypothetical protein